jgi:glycerophosphoryl diester phosphodiesterase
VPFINVNRTTTNTSRGFLDGPEGSTATPDQPWTAFGSVNSVDGPMGNFGIAWAGTPDFPGSIVAKTYGMNADLLPSTVDNTGIYSLMYTTLFGIDPVVLAQRGEVLVGTEGNDTTLPGESTVPGFDGRVSTVFTGAGNDEVDVALRSGFENRIFTGSGVDTIHAGSRDVITGGSGDDWITAEAGDANRLSGGLGNDTFIIGSSGNRALGGAGDDKFHVLGGAGTNYLNGGADADQFWLVSEIGDRPAAKQFVMDFQLGVDKVGMQGAAFSSLGFTQVGADTLLKVAGVEVGHFTNLSAASLNNQANFAGLV